MREQGALPEFMRKIPLTTRPPIPDRRPGCSKDIDSGILADLRRLYPYGRRLTILRSGVKNLEIRRLIVRRMGVGCIHFFCWMDELGERQGIQFRAFAEKLQLRFTSLRIGEHPRIPMCAALDLDDGRVMVRRGHLPLRVLIVNHNAQPRLLPLTRFCVNARYNLNWFRHGYSPSCLRFNSGCRESTY